MVQLTTRYLLASIGLIAVCIFFAQQSWGGKTYAGIFLYLAPFVVGVSTLVHLAATLMGLKSWPKWLFAALAPTACLVGWFVYGVSLGLHSKRSIGVDGLFLGGVFWFSIGFAIVDFLMVAINRIGASHELEDRVE